MEDERSAAGLFSPRVAAKVARVSYQSFQAWARASLLHGRRVPIGRRGETVYSYRDLILIRLIVRLKSQGARPKAIRVALETIEMMADGDHNAWMRATIMVNSGMVVAVLPDKPEWSPMAVSRGPQRVSVVFFPDLIQELRDELVPPDRFPSIEVNSEVLGGAPVIKGTRITTMAVSSVQRSGGDPSEAYPSLNSQQIENAEAYERFLGAA